MRTFDDLPPATRHLLASVIDAHLAANDLKARGLPVTDEQQTILTTGQHELMRRVHQHTTRPYEA
jgi:hypothetical protein